MDTATAQTPAKELIPANAESGSRAIRRVRLAKALAATARGRIPGLVSLPEWEGTKAERVKRPKSESRRYKLDAADHVRLAALKRRLEVIGLRVKRGELIRAGLLALVAMDDDRLKAEVARVTSADHGAPARQVA